MYYRGSHFDEQTRKAAHAEVVCYAESLDGIHWTKPELGLCEFAGSRANNIVWNGPGGHNFTPFRDANPDCAPEARYKALAGGRGGLLALQSADGLHWSLIRDEPVITKGAFDSQNLAFWDSHAGLYREFHRQFRGERDIMTGTSSDFLDWTEPVFLEYPGAPKEHLYTNAILSYERAPQLLIGFPTRFFPDRGQQVEPIFMTSRDGLHFRRWSEAFLRPGPRQSGSWVYGDNFLFWGMVETPSVFGDAPPELSLYGTENYWEGDATSIRRYSLRVDGFVSAGAPYAGGEVLTRPLLFTGGSLALNLETSAFGDRLRHIVRWKDRGGDLRPLEGTPVRLRLRLRDADLYAFQFVPYFL